MRNFGSRDIYNLNDSTPVYANACSPSDFASHMAIQALQIEIVTGMKNATIGGFTGGQSGAVSAGIESLTLEHAGGATSGFIDKIHEC